MSVSILSRTISGSTDKKMVFQNAQAARVISIGSSWNELWLGLRAAFTDTGGNISSKVLPMWGLISNPTDGLTNGVLGSATSNFIGNYSSPFTAAWTRVVSGANVAYQGTLSEVLKVGAAVSSAAGNTALFSGDPTIRFPYIHIFRRISSSQIDVDTVYPSSSANPIPDCSLDLLKAAMETASRTDAAATLNAVLGALKIITNTSAVTGINETTNGAFNAVTFGYNRTVNQAEFSEILYAIKS